MKHGTRPSTHPHAPEHVVAPLPKELPILRHLLRGALEDGTRVGAVLLHQVIEGLVVLCCDLMVLLTGMRLCGDCVPTFKQSIKHPTHLPRSYAPSSCYWATGRCCRCQTRTSSTEAARWRSARGTPAVSGALAPLCGWFDLHDGVLYTVDVFMWSPRV